MFARQVSVMLGFRDLPEDALRAIAAPSLVMLGDADVPTVEHAAAHARLLGAQLAVFPGCGHGTYLAAAAATPPGRHLPALGLAVLEAFLSAAAPRAAP